MPTLHRLSCFRDDLIFFIFLWQRWAYRTDHSRVNEFGTVADEDSAGQQRQQVQSAAGFSRSPDKSLTAALRQKWAYPTDYKRVNEFGAAFVSEEEQKRIEEEDREKREKAERGEAEAKRDAYVEEIKEGEQEREGEGEEESGEAADQPVQDEASMRQRKQVAATTAAAAVTASLAEMD